MRSDSDIHIVSERAVQLDPKYTKAWYRLAKAHESMNNVDKARESYETAMKLAEASNDVQLTATIRENLNSFSPPVRFVFRSV